MSPQEIKKLARKAAIELTMRHKDADEKFGGLSGIRPADDYEEEEKKLEELWEKIFLRNETQKENKNS